MEELWKDWPRELWRSLRRRIGLPASSDVRILSDMLRSLLKLAPEQQNSLVSAVISYPSIVGLYDEDISDAAEFLGVRAMKGNHLYQPREIVAAYAGHSMGLCENYKNKDKCIDEGLQLPSRHTLLVEYTEDALLLQGDVLREAIDFADADIDADASFILGSNNSQSEGHAQRVKDFVLQFLRNRYLSEGPPGLILLIMVGRPGSVGDETVQNAILDAIWQLGSKANIITSMPGYVAARGAAEFAWRAQNTLYK
ncbi:hypothetical protein FQN50_000111 [Emmonsiellopsis sp. PD_5]|nr:hypothetical protein FQN50_000111 [Emmonsiellopsis sp. PD_5]